MKEHLKSWLLAVGCLLLTSLYPCLYQYSSNLPESRGRDMLLFWGIFLGIGIVLFLLWLVILRRVEAAGVLSALSLLVCMNFGLVKTGVQRLLPLVSGRWILGPLGVLLLLLGGLVFLRKWRCRVPLILLTCMFGGLCAVSGIVALPKLAARHVGGQESSLLSAAETADGAERPNVYYFLYDEYSGPESLRYYYGFDNSTLYDQLEQRGFDCSGSSYNTESCATVQLVPDLYALGYDAAPFQSGDGEMPNLYRIFQDLGYQINLISHNDFLDTDGARSLTSGQAEESICRYLYANSILPYTPAAEYMEQHLRSLRTAYQYVAMLDEVLDTMDQAWEETGGAPTLTLGYVQCPHPGFIYDENGGLVSEDNFVNWRDPQYYLGQLQYTSSRILKAVDNIQAHDPEAVIILQSDHGARLGHHLAELYGDPYDAETDTIHQQNILNCVYLPGETVDITGLNGINTLRTVLNRLFQLDYAMVEPRTGCINYYP